jgi:GNAT superfamily N-acetyltransferase
MAGTSDALTTAPCELLEWDSEHFGFPIARVRANALTEDSAETVDDWCGEHGIRCLYLSADVGDAETARVAPSHGFRLVDVRATARRPYEGLLELEARSDLVTVREATETELVFAKALAARSHHTSRFYFDENFPRDRCDALYEAWVERGYRDPERRLLIGVVGGEPVGYMVAGPLGPEREGHGELVAVDERHRGKGFGRAIHFGEYRDYAARGALTQKATMSLRALASIRLHEQLGYRTDQFEAWHHKWYGGG